MVLDGMADTVTKAPDKHVRFITNFKGDSAHRSGDSGTGSSDSSQRASTGTVEPISRYDTEQQSRRVRDLQNALAAANERVAKLEEASEEFEELLKAKRRERGKLEESIDELFKENQRLRRMRDEARSQSQSRRWLSSTTLSSSRVPTTTRPLPIFKGDIKRKVDESNTRSPILTLPGDKHTRYTRSSEASSSHHSWDSGIGSSISSQWASLGTTEPISAYADDQQREGVRAIQEVLDLAKDLITELEEENEELKEWSDEGRMLEQTEDELMTRNHSVSKSSLLPLSPLTAQPTSLVSGRLKIFDVYCRNEADGLAVVKLLLEKGAEVDSKDNSGQTPMSWAAIKGYEAVVKLLLEKGAEVDSKDNNSQTSMSWAAINGNQAVVKLLLEKGAEVDSKDKNSQTPMSWAAMGGHEAVVKLLLEKGAEVDSKDKNGQTPMSWTARKGHGAVVKLLLEKGAEVDSKDNSGQTPMSWAAIKGYEAVVKVLLEKGAEVDSKDTDGMTPMSWAATKGYEAVVKLLLEKGAEVDSKDKNGQTPMSWAAMGGHEAVVKLLLEKGAEVDSKDKNGQTLMSWTATKGYEAVVKVLLEKGAEVDSKDTDGMTLLSNAAICGHGANKPSKIEALERSSYIYPTTVYPFVARNVQQEPSNLEGLQTFTPEMRVKENDLLENKQNLIKQILADISPASPNFTSIFPSVFAPRMNGVESEDLRRLEWTCRCGMKSHEYFKELQVGAVATLATELMSSGYITHARISNDPQPRPAVLKIYQRLTNIVGKACNKLRNLSGPVLPYFASKSSTAPISLCTQAQTCRWLHVCLPKSLYATKLEPLHITCDAKQQPSTDATLFNSLRSTYYKQRNWKELLFFRLSRIDFIKFEALPDDLVDGLVPNEVPPPTQTDYDFVPTPPTTIPPISAKHMIHLFQNCHRAPDGSDFYLRRIPKKTIQPLVFDPKRADGNAGWGLNFVEVLDQSLAAKVMFVLSLVLGLGFGISWSVMEKDVSGGFGVAAYIVAVLTLAVVIWQSQAA
ncbi:hypothetical protein BP6252_09685 [Coleophoma cylindrospora]|uniref:Uncharacterized protein n=1 Tax=Coleophoma cylindrospora TaxID=1849047 RepID=A0A3D8QWI2_9HELO|nr:hypothetical protein BP6252_09685 [Coleophoma cylindrospora]